jgi:transposase InsO family protein
MAHGNRFLVVMRDRFSNFTDTVPFRTKAELVASKAFFELWMFCYEPPRHVISDNEPQFAAKFFQAVCRGIGIEKVFYSAFHPRTNWQVELFNQTIVNSLRGYLAGRQGYLDE